MSEGGESGCDLLVILDGLAEPSGPRTTLSVARTPALDALAGPARLCRIDPQDGARVQDISSERGIARLLGLSPRESGALSRGGLLSLLTGDPSPSEGFFLATPVSFGKDGRLLRYVNPREAEDAFWTALLKRVNGDEPWRFLPVPGVGGRIDRMLLSLPRWSGGDAGHPPRRGASREESASVPGFSEWLSGILPPSFSDSSDPERRVDGLWLWGGGRAPVREVPSERSDRLAVCATSLVRAIGRMAGFRSAPLSRATGDTDTDLSEKMERVEEGLRHACSRILLHFEGFDMASHRRDPEEKRRFLERVDREVFARIIGWFGEGRLTSLSITSDHQSSPLTGNHEAGPVPALFLSRKAFGGRSPGGLRMTEWGVRDLPLVPMEQWTKWSDRPSGEDEAGYPGKDLCLAL